MKPLIITAAFALVAPTLKAQNNTTAEPDSLHMDVQLSEAGVTAYRPVARIKNDALVTKVEGTPLSKAGTADDLLARIPGLQRTKDGIEVTGKGKPVYYINGRRVRDVKELERLQSEEIHSVDVVQNPGARYDATATAVVRIRTVRRKGEGWGVSAGSSFKTYSKNRFSYNPNVDLNYRHNGLDLFAGADFYDYKSFGGNDITFISTTDEGTWEQRTSQWFNRRSNHLTLKGGANYQFSPKHSAGVRYEFGRRPKASVHGMFNADVFKNDVQTDRIESTLDGNQEIGNTHSVNAYYNGQISGGELTIDADGYFEDIKNNQRTMEESAAGAPSREVPTENPVSNRLYAAKADYVHPLWGGQLSVGTHFYNTDRKDTYRVLSNVALEGVVSTAARLKETMYAGYVDYAHQLLGGQLSAGLRYEHVAFSYFADGVRQDEQCRTFSNVFPSVSYARPFGKLQLIASYSAKTIRPSYDDLSSNVTYGNRFTLQTGNPLLHAATKHNASLIAVWKFLQGMVNFTQTDNDIINWAEDIPGHPEITKLYKVNKSIPLLLTSLTASPTFGCWHPTLAGTYIQQWLEMPHNGAMKKYNKPLFQLYLSNDVQLPWKVLFNAQLSWQSKGNYQNAYLNASRPIWASFYFQRSFMKNDALSLTLGMNDLFRRNYLNMAYMNRSFISMNQPSWNRCAYVTLRYTFNAANSKYKGGRAAEEVKGRM